MKGKIKYCIALLLLCTVAAAWAQNAGSTSKLHLYTDRTYSLSGDTLWFKVWLPKLLDEKSNIVRVQLNSSSGQVISTVASKSELQWSDGFLSIPDSLSTGIYFVNAFFNEQRSNATIEIEAKTLFVYNRFEEAVTEISLPKSELIYRAGSDEELLEINTPKMSYGTRDLVEGEINIRSSEIAHATISAKLVDPLADVAGGYIKRNFVGTHKIIPAFAEKDGILISGKVLNEKEEPQNNTIVLLSISSEPPYFDYCISNENGGFNFFLLNASGDADLILQAVSSTGEELYIEPETNSLEQTDYLAMENKVLNPKQTAFINTVIQAKFIQKLFNKSSLSYKEPFEMPARFDVPFYGKPTKRVTPSEFFDLPDFREISRELLHGIQYRTQNDEVTFRLLNSDRGQFFNNEPLRLLNGIPVFKNAYFTALKSTDISYIDIVQHERIFGDLHINGVMAVSLNDKSNAWLAQQANVYQFNIPCLQAHKTIPHGKQSNAEKGEPDVRQNYLWETLPAAGSMPFRFLLSDLKGKVEITVEGKTTSNTAFKTSKIIEVN